MKLNNLKPSPGSKKLPNRKGRGPGTGNGKTAGKGHKGQNARSGGGVRPGFEGGQMPLYRLLPKRGFNNKRYAALYTEVSLSSLDVFEDGEVVTEEMMLQRGVVSKINDGVVILGNGNIEKKLTVKAARFTNSAKVKLEAAGGKAEVI